jgi:hypothetical protein
MWIRLAVGALWSVHVLSLLAWPIAMFSTISLFDSPLVSSAESIARAAIVVATAAFPVALVVAYLGSKAAAQAGRPRFRLGFLAIPLLSPGAYAGPWVAILALEGFFGEKPRLFAEAPPGGIFPCYRFEPPNDLEVRWPRSSLLLKLQPTRRALLPFL